MLPIEDFNFEFPEELIASAPAEPRDNSRLMVVDRASGKADHRTFKDLPDFMESGDCLVLNKTKVFSCRLLGKKSTGGKADLLLVREIEPGLWGALASGFKPGMTLHFPADLTAVVESLNSEGEYLCRFNREAIMTYLEMLSIVL